MTKKTSNRFSPEVRERAVRMVLEHGGDHASQWAAISSIASPISVESVVADWRTALVVSSAAIGFVLSGLMDRGRSGRGVMLIDAVIPLEDRLAC